VTLTFSRNTLRCWVWSGDKDDLYHSPAWSTNYARDTNRATALPQPLLLKGSLQQGKIEVLKDLPKVYVLGMIKARVQLNITFKELIFFGRASLLKGSFQRLVSFSSTCSKYVLEVSCFPHWIPWQPRYLKQIEPSCLPQIRFVSCVIGI